MATASLGEHPPVRSSLILRTTRRYWIGFFAIWLTSTLFGLALINALMKPAYMAYSVLRIEVPSYPLFDLKTSSETYEMFVQTQLQLITSPNVLSAAGTSPKVQNLPRIRTATDVIQELKKVVDVELVPGTTLVEVSMTSLDSRESAYIVNAVLEAYLKTHEQWVDSSTRAQIERLEHYLSSLQGRIEELERQWEVIVAQGDVDARILNLERQNRENPNSGQPQPISIDEFRKLQSELFLIHLERIKAEAWAEDLKRTAAPDAVETDFDPLWKQRPAQIQAAVEPTSAVDLVSHRLREAEMQVRNLRVREAALREWSAKFEVVSGNPDVDAVKIQLLLDQRTDLKEMQDVVIRRLEQFRQEARGGTNIRLINEATISLKPLPDSRPLLMSLTPLVMLFEAFGYLLVVAYFYPPRIGPVAVRLRTSPNRSNTAGASSLRAVHLAVSYENERHLFWDTTQNGEGATGDHRPDRDDDSENGQDLTRLPGS